MLGFSALQYLACIRWGSRRRCKLYIRARYFKSEKATSFICNCHHFQNSLDILVCRTNLAWEGHINRGWLTRTTVFYLGEVLGCRTCVTFVMHHREAQIESKELSKYLTNFIFHLACLACCMSNWDTSKRKLSNVHDLKLCVNKFDNTYPLCQCT